MMHRLCDFSILIYYIQMYNAYLHWLHGGVIGKHRKRLLFTGVYHLPIYLHNIHVYFILVV